MDCLKFLQSYDFYKEKWYHYWHGLCGVNGVRTLANSTLASVDVTDFSREFRARSKKIWTWVSRGVIDPIYFGGVKMAKLTKEEVKHVAHLARLAITEEEAEKFADQLGKITDFAEQLNELDTTNVEPTSHVLPLVNVLREDVAKEGLPREKVMLNVKEQEAGQIKVPSIMD